MKGLGVGKMKFFKGMTPRSRTNELHGQGGKKNVQNQDEQTPHIVLQNLSPKLTPGPLRV